MKTFLKIAVGVCFVVVAGLYLFVPNVTTFTSEPSTIGAFNPASGEPYRLQSSIGTTDTSIRLSSFTTPISNVPITMTILDSDIGYGTLDPQSSSRKELISFTGVTQNADGTAILTGVTRGLQFVSPFTATSTLRKAHPGQSLFILSDSPQLFEEYAARRSADTISGGWTFTAANPPKYDVNPDFSSLASTTFASTGFVASTSYNGTVDASETVKGIIELATGAEAAAGTSIGSTLARLVLPASIATSTGGVSGGPWVVITSTAGKIAQSFLDLTEAFIFAGNVTVQGIFTSATSTLGTTSISGLSYPTVDGSNGYVVTTNGAGTLSLQNLVIPHYSYATTTSDMSVANTSATSTPLYIPAGVLTASSTITAMANFQCNDGGSDGTCYYTLTANNVPIASCEYPAANGIAARGQLTIQVFNIGSVSSQLYRCGGGSAEPVQVNIFSQEGSSSVDTSAALALRLTVRSSSGGATAVINNLFIDVRP